jgi:hypothetical protein
VAHESHDLPQHVPTDLTGGQVEAHEWIRTHTDADAALKVSALVKPGRKLGHGKLLWEHRTGFRVVERYAPAHVPASSSAAQR